MYGRAFNITEGSIVGGRYQGWQSSDYFVYKDVTVPMPNYLYVNLYTYIPSEMGEK